MDTNFGIIKSVGGNNLMAIIATMQPSQWIVEGKVNRESIRKFYTAAMPTQVNVLDDLGNTKVVLDIGKTLIVYEVKTESGESKRDTREIKPGFKSGKTQPAVTFAECVIAALREYGVGVHIPKPKVAKTLTQNEVDALALINQAREMLGLEPVTRIPHKPAPRKTKVITSPTTTTKTESIPSPTKGKGKNGK